jgi:hypothetical protein
LVPDGLVASALVACGLVASALVAGGLIAAGLLTAAGRLLVAAAIPATPVTTLRFTWRGLA